MFSPPYISPIKFLLKFLFGTLFRSVAPLLNVRGMQDREGEETAFKLPVEPAPAVKNKRSQNVMKVYFADKQFWFEDFRNPI